MNISGFFVSFWQLTTRVILSRRRQVLFYYPQHFNRTAAATNPFFDRLLETCDRHGISYHLIEEPDWGTDKPRNPRATKGDAFFMLVTALRKVVAVFWRVDFYARERVVARIANVLTFGRLRCPRYVTISGSMIHLFAYLSPQGQVYDMQHGILYKQHPTFFDEHERLRPAYFQPNLHWLFWGKGYETCFCRGDEEVLKGRTHVVGNPVPRPAAHLEQMDDAGRRAVLVSLQLTTDWSMEDLECNKRLLDEALQALRESHVHVLLKHHPRYNNVIPIDDLLGKYDFVSLTTLSMAELLPQTLLQVSVNSTTAFEYAEYGIPSFFIDPDGQLPRGALFYDEYRYPLYADMDIASVVERLRSDAAARTLDQQTVAEWYHCFYDNFSPDAFLRAIDL